jgi:hypothetical protein
MPEGPEVGGPRDPYTSEPAFGRVVNPDAHPG